MSAWDIFWEKGDLPDYAWLLQVKDALEGKNSFDTSEVQRRLVVEEDNAHIQELTSVLRPFYEARSQLEGEVRYQEAVIIEERSASKMWKTDLKGAKNEWSRIGAIMEAQEFGVEDLNDLTGHRRRMSSQKGESLVGASLSQRRLNQAEELRDRAESLLAHVESQILAYELKRREFVAHKQAASIEYAVSACVDGRQP